MKKRIICNKSYQNFLLILSIIVLFFSTIIPINTISLSNKEKTSNKSLLMGEWESQESGTTIGLNGVSFIETDTVTTVGDSATILHTNDGGDNWDVQACGVNVNFYDVSFYDKDVGMIVGAEGTIIYTNNGGNSWDTYQTGWMTEYYGSYMVSDLIGFAVGENTIFQPLVTWTTDGWNSKNDVVFYLEHNSILYEGKLFDVCFVDANTGYAAAAVWNGEGAIVKTINGGWNWETIYWSNNAFYSIDFSSANVGYAVGDDGIIIKTIDAGNNWQIQDSGVENNYKEVSFPTDNVGTIVGGSGIIIRTEDGGDNWVEEESGTSNDLISVDFIDSSNGYAVGKSGTILHHIGSQPPDAPEINGPISGKAGIMTNYTFISTDPENEDIYYYIDWGDGQIEEWLGPFPSGEQIIFSHIWSEIGTYAIKAKVKDINNLESDWSESLFITISNPPNKPIITGPTNFKPNQEKEFTFTTTDPDNDQIYFIVDWGDGTNSGWKGPYISGYELKLLHSWTEKSQFTIKCKAKDTNDLESEYGTFDISTSRSKIFNKPFLRVLGCYPNLFPIFQKLLNHFGQ